MLNYFISNDVSEFDLTSGHSFVESLIQFICRSLMLVVELNNFKMMMMIALIIDGAMTKYV